MNRLLFGWLLAGACERPQPAPLVAVVPAAGVPSSPPAAAEAPTPDAQAISLPSTPQLTLIDQDGQPVRPDELLALPGPVAVQFIFTRCQMICPVMGAGFGALQDLAPGTRLVSISITPEADTPESLRTWGERFGRREGWTLLTGAPADVEALLRAWGVYTPVVEQHAPVVLLGQGGRWMRANGLAPAADLAATLARLAAPPNPKAQEWFTDTPLVDQDGNTFRFYSDLIAGRRVVINAFFARCQGSCPSVNGNLKRLHEALGERAGRDVEMLSISLDPEVDTPEALKGYAAGFGAPRGWRFLTGPREDVERVLGQLGLWAPDKEAHAPVVLIGNDATGLWKKAHGYAAPEELASIVQSVLDDPGVPDAPVALPTAERSP